MVYHYPFGFSFCAISEIFSVLWKSLVITGERGRMEQRILPAIMCIYLGIDLILPSEPEAARCQGQ